MASCGFVQTAISVLGVGVVTQANILQGVIIGVGFIGAGAIIREGATTTGNATAASVWTVGVIGAPVGYGYYDIGVILAAANFVVLLIRAHFPERHLRRSMPAETICLLNTKANTQLGRSQCLWAKAVKSRVWPGGMVPLAPASPRES